MNHDLAFAHQLADLADERAVPLFARPTQFHDKDDGSLVGEADLLINQLLVDHIATRRPDDAILSEEAGEHGAAPRLWIIDPIDGTDAFLAGEPHWGTHIALQEDGEITVAVVTRPAMGLRWWASKGEGAWRGHARGGVISGTEQLHVRATGLLRDCRVSGWFTNRLPCAPIVRDATWVDSAYNDLLRVVNGELDVMIVPGRVWDHAPFELLLREAGGSLLDPEGGARLDLGAALFTNGAADAELRVILQSGFADALGAP